MAKTTKKSYKITNWAQYNNSLVARGDITFWFSDEAIQQWEHQNQQKKRGRPFVYSDTAIETLLILRELFRLPYRQTEGLGKSLVQLMQADVRIPDFTSLAKRAANMRCSLLPKNRSRTIDVVVDSTGLKVYGEGEWKTRTHGKSKRRTWRKLHLAVDPDTQEIVAELLTENRVHDSQAVDDLLKEIDSDVKVRKFSGDGGYDTWDVHTTLKTRNITAIIPPQKNAKIKQHGNSSEEPLPRDQAIREIRRKGRKRWKQEIGYHRRSLAETAMYRIKNPFGVKLKNRILQNQKTEARLRSKILNRFTQIGMPNSVWN